MRPGFRHCRRDHRWRLVHRQATARELENAVGRSNEQLRKALVNYGGSMTVELVSLDQHLFSSTAQYRLKANDINLGHGEVLSFDLGVTDQIEHGPFPWSRVRALQLMPVLAASTSSLQKDDLTAPWFAAAGEQSPIRAHTSLGFSGNVDSNITVAPLKHTEANGSSLDFSGMTLEVSGDQQGKASKFHGSADRFEMKLVGDDQPPTTLELSGLKVGGNLAASKHDAVYVGDVDMLLAQAKATLGDKQQVLVLKGLQQTVQQTLDGPDTVAGRVDYRVADITWDGRAVGNVQMGVSVKSVNAPALQSLSKWYQAHLPEFEAAQAAGQPVPEIQMDEAEKARFHSDLQQLLASRPKLAIDNLALRTANGESRFELSMDFSNPTSFDLPPDQLSKQLITEVKSKLTLSADDRRPGDLAGAAGRADRCPGDCHAVRPGRGDGRHDGAAERPGHCAGQRCGVEPALCRWHGRFQRQEDDGRRVRHVAGGAFCRHATAGLRVDLNRPLLG